MLMQIAKEEYCPPARLGFGHVLQQISRLGGVQQFLPIVEGGNRDGLNSKLAMFSESFGSLRSTMRHVCPHCQPALD